MNNLNPILLGVVYRPPNGSVKNFNESLSKVLSSIKPSNNTIIMGDFNINLLSTNKCSSSFEELILCNGFSPIISTATRQKPKCQATCIDNILVNNHNKVLKNGTLETQISHHKSVYITYNSSIKTFSIQDKNQNTVLKYDFSNANLEKLNETLCKKFSTFTNGTSHLNDSPACSINV